MGCEVKGQNLECGGISARYIVLAQFCEDTMTQPLSFLREGTSDQVMEALLQR